MLSRRRSLVPGAAAVACVAAAVLVAGCGSGDGQAGGGAANARLVTLPNGTTIGVGQLTPFRDCLRDHGVTGQPFGQAPSTPLPTRAEMRVRIACAGKLPSSLDRLYLRLDHRIAR